MNDTDGFSPHSSLSRMKEHLCSKPGNTAPNYVLCSLILPYAFVSFVCSFVCLFVFYAFVLNPQTSRCSNFSYSTSTFGACARRPTPPGEARGEGTVSCGQCDLTRKMGLKMASAFGNQEVLDVPAD